MKENKLNTKKLINLMDKAHLSKLSKTQVSNQMIELLENGASVNAKNDDWSIIHYAVYNNLIQLVKKLIDLGVDLNQKDSYENTPIVLALIRNGDRMLNLLLDNKVKIDINFKGENILRLLVVMNTKNLKKLLKIYPNLLNAQDYDDNTLLHNAVDSYFDYALDNIDLLLKSGANPNLKDWSGSTPLHDACEINDLERVKKLIEAGADPRIKNKDGLTPIEVAKDQKIIEYLSNIPAISLKKSRKTTKKTTKKSVKKSTKTRKSSKKSTKTRKSIKKSIKKTRKTTKKSIKKSIKKSVKKLTKTRKSVKKSTKTRKSAQKSIKKSVKKTTKTRKSIKKTRKTTKKSVKKSVKKSTKIRKSTKKSVKKSTKTTKKTRKTKLKKKPYKIY